METLAFENIEAVHKTERLVGRIVLLVNRRLDSEYCMEPSRVLNEILSTLNEIEVLAYVSLFLSP